VLDDAQASVGYVRSTGTLGALMAKKSKKSSDPCSAARERIYKSLLKRNWLLAPTPVTVRATTIGAVLPKRFITRARGRHAQLATQFVRADPQLA